MTAVNVVAIALHLRIFSEHPSADVGSCDQCQPSPFCRASVTAFRQSRTDGQLCSCLLDPRGGPLGVIPLRAGIGPEPLRDNLAGCWSRRIDQEHRLVYRLEGKVLVILAC